MASPLPYQCDYALSNRASCKKCQEGIGKDELRLAARTRSRYNDDLVPQWYHYECFFEKFSPAGAEQFIDIDIIRYQDQLRIIESVNSKLTVTVKKKVAGKKRKSDAVIQKNPEFTTEYAKSGRSRCVLCKDMIPKAAVRIGREDTKSEEALTFGAFFRWFCVKCFVTVRLENEFYDSAESMLGFEKLSDKDQKMLLKQIKEVPRPEEDSLDGSTMDTASQYSQDSEDSSLSTRQHCKQLQQQSDKVYEYLGHLKDMKKNDFEALWEANKANKQEGQDVSVQPEDSRERKFHVLADALAFGLPVPCSTCKGILRFKNFRYQCTGSLDNQWLKCDFKTEKPDRTRIIIPEELKKYDFLKNYKHSDVFVRRMVEPTLKKKLIDNELEAIAKVMKGIVKKEKDAPEIEDKKLFDGTFIGFIGRNARSEYDKKVEEFGGVLCPHILSSTAFVFCDPGEWGKARVHQLKNAKQSKIPVVSTAFFDSHHDGEEIFEAIEPYFLEKWSKDDEDVQHHVESCCRSKVNNVFNPSGSGRSGVKEATVVVKNGGIVHPGFTTNKTVHVLRHNDCIYSAKLHRTLVDKDINSFYIMQILQDDLKPHLIYLFKTWGRVGVESPENQTTDRVDLAVAVNLFERAFEEKTHNTWANRKNFERKYGAYYYTEDVDEDLVEDLKTETTESKLHPSLLDLLCKLFDRNQMENTMKEFKIDLEKMPLGKLNQKQLLEACSTLKEIGEMIDSPGTLRHGRLLSLCEKFYTLVPHSFGNRSIELINTREKVKQENKMLEALLELEVAFSIMAKKKSDSPAMDPFDHHYKMLKTELKPLESTCEEYRMIETYLQNTHASTHQMYKLKLNNVFSIERHGEHERFKPFEMNENRKLLWHGSRLTNFVGILSQGLRIAPPEAPASGYMFGKGVYFADSASKSANYCYNTHMNSDGLLMLSEVALGTPRELLSAENVTKLDKGFHSVKGCGASLPDPKSDITLENGCVVPTGKLIQDRSNKQFALQYNEYIVYDVAQIKQRYLLQIEFLDNIH